MTLFGAGIAWLRQLKKCQHSDSSSIQSTIHYNLVFNSSTGLVRGETRKTLPWSSEGVTTHVSGNLEQDGREPPGAHYLQF